MAYVHVKRHPGKEMYSDTIIEHALQGLQLHAFQELRYQAFKDRDQAFKERDQAFKDRDQAFKERDVAVLHEDVLQLRAMCQMRNAAAQPYAIASAIGKTRTPIGEVHNWHAHWRGTQLVVYPDGAVEMECKNHEREVPFCFECSQRFPWRQLGILGQRSHWHHGS